jgi:glutathionyl-hydroquinone reductase
MKDGRFVRQANRFTDRIGTDEFPAEAGRYRSTPRWPARGRTER